MEIRFAKGNWKQMQAMVVGIDNSKAIGEMKRRLPSTALQRQDPLENCIGAMALALLLPFPHISLLCAAYSTDTYADD